MIVFRIQIVAVILGVDFCDVLVEFLERFYPSVVPDQRQADLVQRVVCFQPGENKGVVFQQPGKLCGHFLVY